jgi:anti-anti-sigma factor
LPNSGFESPTPQVVRSERLSQRGAVLIIDGELDLDSASQLGTEIAVRIEEGHRHLVIDLTDATFLDSVAMATLLSAVAPLRTEPDAAVVLAGSDGVVARALEVSGIGRLFTTFDTRDGAIAGLHDGPERLIEVWRRVGGARPGAG